MKSGETFEMNSIFLMLGPASDMAGLFNNQNLNEEKWIVSIFSLANRDSKKNIMNLLVKVDQGS